MRIRVSSVALLAAGILLGFGSAQMRSQNEVPTKLSGNVVHVGMIVPNVDQASRDFADIFGLEPKAPVPFTGIVYPAGYAGDPKAHPKTVTYRVTDTLSVELIEPMGGKSPWRDFLDSTGGVGGLHHIDFATKGIDAYMALLRRKGGTIEFGGSAGATPVSYAYVNMRPKLGFTIELNGPPKE